MKRLKLLFISICLLLASCGNSDHKPANISVTGISTSEPTFTINVGQIHELNYLINPSNATNKSVTITERANAFDIIDGKVIGKSVGDGEVTVTTVDGGYSVKYIVTVLDNIINYFPAKELLAYYDENKIDVVVPNYTCHNQKAYFSYDIPANDHFEIYIANTTINELTEYKSNLLLDNWHEINEAGGGIRYQFKDTPAKLAIFDYLDYSSVTLSFYIDTHIEYNAIKIMNDVAINAWGMTSEEMFVGPDRNGIIRAVDFITSTIENPEDTPECLSRALLTFADTDTTDFPNYIFRLAWPKYDTDKRITRVYFGTSNWSYILYMYSFYEDDIIKIRFEAGPEVAYQDKLQNIV